MRFLFMRILHHAYKYYVQRVLKSSTVFSSTTFPPKIGDFWKSMISQMDFSFLLQWLEVNKFFKNESVKVVKTNFYARNEKLVSRGELVRDQSL